MPEPSKNQYRRCFISAPVGLDLGALPELLAARSISWEWAKEEPASNHDINSRISKVDFVIVVINGTQADYRGAFDAGVATGQRKPVLLIHTKRYAIPLDFRRFTSVKASLSNREALSFHLDLFLAAPRISNVPINVERSMRPQQSYRYKTTDLRPNLESDLERRVYDAVIAAGGTAISQPRSDPDARYRPDFLAWLGHLNPELLDPVAIEVRGASDAKDARRLEEQLLTFMQSARIRFALVLTALPPPEREQQLSLNVLWLTIEEFEALTQASQLGTYLQEVRNRIAHGAR